MSTQLAVSHRLTTRRLILRDYELADAPALVAIFSNSLNTMYDPQKNGPAETTIANYRKHIREWREEGSKGEKALMAVALKSEDGMDGPVIGMAGYPWLPVNSNGRSGNTGVLIDSAYARKGYGSEALTAVLDYGFDILNFDRIEQCTLAANKPYRSLMRSMGLEPFGRELDDPVPAKVEWEYSLTSTEWQDVKRKHAVKQK